MRIGGRNATRDNRPYVARGRLSLRSPSPSTTQKSRRDVRVRTAQWQVRDAADDSIITWEADGVVAALPASHAVQPSPEQ